MPKILLTIQPRRRPTRSLLISSRRKSVDRASKSPLKEASHRLSPITLTLWGNDVFDFSQPMIDGGKAMQVSIGLMILGSTFFIARAFNLPALEAISREILFYLPFAVIVLFQAEIRRALARMGGNPLVALFRHRRSAIPFDYILDACDILATRKIGALDRTLR